MRKVTSIMLVAVLFCGLLIGCGSTRDKGSNSAQKQQTSDFDKDTNVKKEVMEYSYEVPKDWREKSTDLMTYFYAKDSTLMVYYESAIGVSMSDADAQEAFSENIASGLDEFELIDSSETAVAGQTALKLDITYKVEKHKFIGTLIAFDYSDGIVAFMMGTLASSNKDYTDDFNMVVKSISKNASAADTTQTKKENSNSKGNVEAIDMKTDTGNLKYVKHEIGKDYEGKPLINIYFDYTNVGSKNSSSIGSFRFMAFQNGVERELGTPDPYSDERKNLTKEVQPGTSLPVCFSYQLDDTTSDITLEIIDYSDWEEEYKQIMTLKL